MFKTPEELLANLVAGNGAIVASANLSDLEVEVAKKFGLMYVDPEGTGYVLMGPNWLRTALEARRVILKQALFSSPATESHKETK